MKFKIDVECSPEEARAFLGLPDVAPMQAALMGDLEQRLREAIRGADPEALMAQWIPKGLQGLEAMQKTFWQNAMAAMGTKDDKDDKD